MFQKIGYTHKATENCAVLAFLSACRTAQGDANAPDQAVHLAASMLFCGFWSVIGTMW
jgi:CHAT domain-containing protein